MASGRKINDDELVEISGGIDGLTEFEMDPTLDSTGPGSTRPEGPTPGGAPDLETPSSSGRTEDAGPGN